jgi:putative oxidoreductase
MKENGMLKFLFYTKGDVSTLFARLFLGIVILPHGLQKLLGMYGGGGYEATLAYFVKGGIPEFIAFLIIIAESIGAIGLIIGFLGRICALAIIVIMTGAIFSVHTKYGFFMNWSGAQSGEGYEYHLLAIGLGLVVLFGGSGRWSLDKFITSRMVF